MNESLLAKSLLSQYESELRVAHSYLPDIHSDIEKQLLLLFSTKEKHQYLSDGYKKSLIELKDANQPEGIVLDDLISNKKKVIERELHKILQTTPTVFATTKQEVVFRSFIMCCNNISSEVVDVEKRVNESPNITSKFIDDVISDAEESLAETFTELNNTIREYSVKEYVDQEININYDTLVSLLSRVKTELIGRLGKNFPPTSYTKLYVQADSSAKEQKINDNSRINLEGFQNLISGIKKYSQEQLEELQSAKEYGILHSVVNSSSDLSVLRLIKQRDTFHEALKDLTDEPETAEREETRFLKAVNGHDQDFFEDLGARLYAAGFIDGQSSNLQFAQLFSGKVVKKKVNWIGARAKAPMLYFMFLLFEKYKVVEYPSQPFPRLVNSFLLDNEIIERDTNAHDVLRSSYKKISKGKYPGKDTRAAIDKIVQSTIDAYK